jgi:hypothetical protein
MNHKQELIKPTFQRAELGDVVKFYELQFNTLIHRAEKLLIPKIQNLSKVYYEVTGEVLNEKLFNDLMNNGLKNIRNKQIEIINKDLSKFKSKSIIELTIKDLDDRLNKVNTELQAVYAEMSNKSQLLAGYPDIEWSDIQVTNGKPSLNYEAIKRKYELRLTTEQQVEFYNLMLEVKASHKKLVAFLKATTYPLSTLSVIGDNGCMQEAYDGSLSIVAESIENI